MVNRKAMNLNFQQKFENIVVTDVDIFLFKCRQRSEMFLKLGYIEFAMAGNYSMLGIQLLLTRRVSYC